MSNEQGNLSLIKDNLFKKHGPKKGEEILRSMFKVIAKNDNKGERSNLV